MALFSETGGLMLGTRLKRLSEKFLAEVASIYRDQGIDFEPTWFPVFYLLNHHQTISITELAEQLEVSQPAVSQMVNQLEKRELLHVTRLPEDRRIRMLTLTAQGRLVLKKILPIWDAIQDGVHTIIQRGSASVLLLEALKEFEQEVKTYSLSELVREKLGSEVFLQGIVPPESRGNNQETSTPSNQHTVPEDL